LGHRVQLCFDLLVAHLEGLAVKEDATSNGQEQGHDNDAEANEAVPRIVKDDKEHNLGEQADRADAVEYHVEPPGVGACVGPLPPRGFHLWRKPSFLSITHRTLRKSSVQKANYIITIKACLCQIGGIGCKCYHQNMTTTDIGRRAEKAAAKYLKKQSYKILAFNWRTRWCEIDIVAAKDKVVFFVEVKYRASSQCGDGLEVITNKKLQQMEFGAQMWVEDHNWPGDYRLMVVSVAGQPPQIQDSVEL
jgi:putative endonuclease